MEDDSDNPIGKRLPKRQCASAAIGDPGAGRPVRSRTALQLFNTTAAPVRLPAAMETARVELAERARGGPLEIPSRPAPPALALGPEGSKSGELFIDQEGRHYRVGKLAWAVLQEQTPEGAKAESAAAAAAAAAGGRSGKKQKKKAGKRRDGAEYYALGYILAVDYSGTLNSTRQAPHVIVQEFLNVDMMKEYRMLEGGFKLPRPLQVSDAWLAARGWRLRISANALVGHAIPEFLEDSSRSAEGAPIAGAVDLEKEEEGGQLMPTRLVERTRDTPDLDMLAAAERALMPVLRPPARSPFDTSDAFAPIAPTVLGHSQHAGTVLSGMSASLGWGHGYLVKMSSGEVRTVTFDSELVDAERARAWPLRTPSTDLHPDIAYQLSRPRGQRAWCMHHSEKILVLDRSRTIALADARARCIIGSPFVLPFLDKEAEPFFVCELAVTAGVVQPWPVLVLPDILHSVQAYYESIAPLSEEVPRGALRRAARAHLAASREPALVPAPLRTRMPMRELAATPFFLLLERVSKSQLIFEWSELSAGKITELLERMFGSRAFAVTDGRGIETLFVLMPTSCPSAARVTYDLDTQELCVFVGFTQYSSSGTLVRGGPMVAPHKPSARARGSWRYSLVELDWVDTHVSPRDDAAERRERFYEHPWYASHFGVWREDM